MTRQFFFKLFISSTFLMLSAATSFSQDEDGEEYFELTLDDLLNIEISVASKTGESSANSPSSVYVLTAADIENLGVRSVEELLNFVPGYFTGLDIEQGKAYRIGARGRSTALSESVLFLVNGFRMNDLYTGGVSIINRLIPVENIKQVEVIRGPGSSLYGSNAFLGVVNIVTKENANDIQLSYGNLNSITASGNFSKKVGKVKLNGFIKGFSNDGYAFDEFTDLMGRTIDMTDPEMGFDAMVSARYKGLTIDAKHHEREFKGFYGLGGVADFNNNEQTSQTMFNVAYKMDVSDKLNINLKTGYRLENWKTKDVILPVGTDLGGGFIMTEDFFAGPFMNSSAFNFSADAAYKISENNELLVGASYERAGISKAVSLSSHDYITFEYFGGIREYYLPFNNTEDKRDIFGIFVQDKHQIGERVRLTLGARLDSYSDFGSSINPRGAVIYNAPWNSIIKVMYGQAFRAPNYLELHDQYNPVDYGNTELDAETIKTFELAYTQNFSVLSATVTYFNNHIDNLIYLDPSANPVVAENNPLLAASFYNQADHISTSGIEVGAIFKPMDKFTFTTTYTELMEDYANMPNRMLTGRANLHLNNFNINLNGIYHGEIKEVSNQKNYVVLNTRLSMELGDVTLFGTIYNIADEVYRTPTTLSNEGVVNRGRTFALGLKLGL